jgi:hypothetical protein
VTIAAHVIYGAIIGAFYELASPASTAAGYSSIAVFLPIAIGTGG